MSWSLAIPTCPRCAAAMVKRTNKANGNVFWGCSAWPKCRSTRDADGESNEHPDPYAQMDSPWDEWDGNDGWGD
jgi:ssDNA-binding Zn-finger/Zn-ribbon topoisomerase 1